ncbi:transcription antiterminator [Clostridioides difficile]|nr:transcription antiterminator [Clostridioides difficile]
MNVTEKIPSIDHKIFKILIICSKKEFVSINSIANELNVTTRSVRTYIKQLNKDLGSDIAVIKYIKGQGYKLEVKDEKILNKIIDMNRKNVFSLNSKEDRVEFILNYLIELDGFITLDSLADEMCVGRTTLVNDFQYVEKVLASYNLNLIKKQNTGMKLHGNELDIRLFILNQLYKNSRKDFNNSKYFKDIKKEELTSLEEELLTLFKNNNFYVTDEMLREVLNYIVVLIYRVKEKNQVKEYNVKFDLLKSYDEYLIAREIKHILSKRFECILNDEEIIYLTIPLVSGNAPASECALNSSRINKNIDELMENIFNQIYIDMGILINEDELRIGLGYHLSFTLNRLLFNIKLKNVLLEEIKQNYILPFKLAQIAGRVIEQKYNLEVSEDEIGYIAIHFSGYLERNSSRFYSIKKIAIICGTGLGTAKLLKIRVEKLIGNNPQIDTLSSFNLRNINLNEYDIVFTTIDLDTSNIGTIVLKINTIFDENKLREQLKTVLCLREGNIDTTNSTNLLINNLLDEDKFMILNEKTILGSLEKMMDNLMDLGCIDDKFRKNIINREEKSPTVFDKGLLFPHSVNEKSDKFLMAIGILEEPIQYANRSIKIILMTMFPCENQMDSDLLVKIYEEVLKIGQDVKLTNKISKCRSFLEFKKVLLKNII